MPGGTHMVGARHNLTLTDTAVAPSTSEGRRNSARSQLDMGLTLQRQDPARNITFIGTAGVVAPTTDVRATMPKLLLTATPGAVVSETVAAARQRLAALRVVHVGAGRHLLPEDQPQAVAQAIAEFLQGL